MNTIEQISYLVGIVGGLIAAFQAIREMRLRNETLLTELRHSQAKEAKALVDELNAKDLAYNALKMVDWSGRSYESSGEKISITFDDIRPALRTTNLSFTPKEGFIRDCFDELLDTFTQYEIYIDAKLVQPADLISYLAYYVSCLSGYKPELVLFMKEYHFPHAETFLARFPRWQSA